MIMFTESMVMIAGDPSSPSSIATRRFFVEMGLITCHVELDLSDLQTGSPFGGRILVVPLSSINSESGALLLTLISEGSGIIFHGSLNSKEVDTGVVTDLLSSFGLFPGSGRHIDPERNSSAMAVQISSQKDHPAPDSTSSAGHTAIPYLVPSKGHPVTEGIEGRQIKLPGIDPALYPVLDQDLDPKNKVADKSGIILADLFFPDHACPGIIRSKDLQALYFPFDIFTQISLWEEEQYVAGNSKGSLASAVRNVHALLPDVVKDRVKAYTRKAKKQLSGSHVSYTSCPVEYSCDSLRLLLINSVVDLMLQYTGCAVMLNRWPNMKRAALVITHDMDSREDIEQGSPLLASIEERCGIRSTWCFVAESADYELPADVLRQLSLKGHEIASHGLYHDVRSDRLSPDEKLKRIRNAKALLEEAAGDGNVTGFRSPGLTRTADLGEIVHRATYAYDLSYPDNDHYNLSHIGKGVSTHVPYYPLYKGRELSLLELPLAALQEAHLFLDHNFSPEQALEVWLKKASAIIRDNGLVVYLFHPSRFTAPDRAWMYESLIQQLCLEKGLWIAPACDIVKWWNAKQEVHISINVSDSDIYEVRIENSSRLPVEGVATKLYIEKNKNINIIKGPETVSIIIDKNSSKWYDICLLDMGILQASEKRILTFSLEHAKEGFI